jgi:prolycopene isomerase
LIGRQSIDKAFSERIESMMPSLSNFILYLGVNAQFESSYPPGAFVFYSSDYDLDRIYQRARDGDILGSSTYAFRVAHDKSTVNVLFLAPFQSKEYWDNNKSKYMDVFIDMVEKHSIPHLSQHIVYKETASPYTLYKYTLNHEGASFGWAGTPSQLAVPNMRKPAYMQGLYLTGHWTSVGGGISATAHLGADTAKIILRKRKI